jgi:hypothetical protein
MVVGNAVERLQFLKGRSKLRALLLLACGILAACTSGPVVPDGDVLVEVPQSGTTASSQSQGNMDFTRTIEGALAEDGSAIPPGTQATPLDADTLNLTLYTIEQQKIDAAIAQRELDAARAQLVIVEPGAVPQATEGVNIALFAQQTTNAVGERRYDRPATARVSGAGNCRRFSNPDQAQRVFLSSGGPQRDTYGLDPDGDGFACSFDPTPYRRLVL